MSKKHTRSTADFVEPLYINGLEGRMLRLPPPPKKKSQILMLYGHHASLERMFGLAEAISKYGQVTLPDLPGFGGMDSFYKIGKEASLDNYADYLAAFIKLRYKNKPITIGAISLGFVIVVRMLQKYPDMAKQVNLVMCFVGFVSKDGFRLPKRTLLMARAGSWFFSRRWPSAFLRTFVIGGPFIRFMFWVTAKKQAKLLDAENDEERERRVKFEIELWKQNDIRTHMYTLHTMVTLNLLGERVRNVPLHFVGVDNDHYFNHHVVREHLQVVFDDCTFANAKLKAHAPTVIADAEEASKFLPPKTRSILRSLK